MKALSLEQYKEFRYGDFPEPEISAEDVLLRVQACGICGSDVHGMDGSTGRRIPPIIMGHEASGVIEKIGTDVENWKLGDRVTFDSTVFCGECDYCKGGQINLCDNRKVMGVSCDDYRQHGAYAEFVAVPARILFQVPDDLSFEEAAFVEPVSIALHAVSLIPIRGGETAVVVGAGMIGLLVLQALKAAGCEKVFCVDLDPKKLELAKTLGADETFISNAETAAEIVETTNGGVDVAMEVVGLSPTLNLAINCLRKGGKLGAVGNLAAQTEFPLQAVVTRELTIYGSCSCNGEYGDALKAISDGSMRVKPLMSAVAPLSEGASWFDRLYTGEADLMKVILKPDSVC